MTLSEDKVIEICQETNRIVAETRDKGMLSKPEEWIQSFPFLNLNCNQLLLSLQEQNGAPDEMIGTTLASQEIIDMPARAFVLDDNLSLRRIAQTFEEKLGKEKIKILVIGGSMTTGGIDVKAPGAVVGKAIAWPRKLEQLLQEKFGEDAVEVVNIALGGAYEETWLERLDVIMSLSPVDIILVESAVNDQNHPEGKVSEWSHQLLNVLMKLPGKPAVMSVELFRLASTVERDANGHCGENKKVVFDPQNSDEPCFYCEHWWYPQTWRNEVVQQNSVARASYRDSVWPSLEQPPLNLCQYWYGLSHPQIGTHVLVASTILFQLLAVLEKQDVLVNLASSEEYLIKLPDADLPKTACLNPITNFRAIQGNPVDAMALPKDDSSCWVFQSDSKDKFGWICEQTMNGLTASLDRMTSKARHTSTADTTDRSDFLRLQHKVQLGSEGKALISRLVSYDERMGDAMVWFSVMISNDDGSMSDANIFEEDPTFTIDSWAKKRQSVPVPFLIELHKQNFKDFMNLTSWDQITEENAPTVLFNIKLLTNTSPQSKKDTRNGIDKFKLVGIVTC